jgi:hypothetical protein
MLTESGAEFDTVYHLRDRPAGAAPGARLLLGLGAVVYHAVRGGDDVVIHHGESCERIVMPDPAEGTVLGGPDGAGDQWIVRWRHRGGPRG